MEKLDIYVSEIDYSLQFISSSSEFDTFIKKQNKPIRVSPELTIKPWSILCSIDFPREQSVEHFKKFLQTQSGIAFANKYLFFNPLQELKKLLEVLPKSVQVYVLGGLALDGYLGKYTRPHNDADLICWRKDIRAVKNALRKLGYGVKEHCFDGNLKNPYMIETDEDNPTISFFIIDEEPNNSFKFKQEILPRKYLGNKKVNLMEVEFTSVNLSFLEYLNKEGAKGLAEIKKNNPELYNILGAKITNNKNDRTLIAELMKK